MTRFELLKVLLVLLLSERSVILAWVPSPRNNASIRHGGIRSCLCRRKCNVRQETIIGDRGGCVYVHTRPSQRQTLLMSVSDENAAKEFETKKIPIQQLLQELEERGIRYEPTATRAELETLLHQSRQAASSHQTIKKIPIKEILDELDYRGIEYPPTASRAELEALVKKKDAAEQSIPPEVPVRNIAEQNSRPISTTTSPRVPIPQLLDELDERGVVYPPTATRAMLEDLVHQSRKNAAKTKPSTTQEMTYSTSARISDEQQQQELRRRRRQQKRKMRLESNKTPLHIVMDKTSNAKQTAQDLPRRVSKVASNTHLSSRLSKVAERAVKKARRVTNQAKEWWEEEGGHQDSDDGLIREPDWYYVKKHTVDRSADEPIDVTAAVIDVDGEVKNVERIPPRQQSAQPRRRRPSPRPRPYDAQHTYSNAHTRQRQSRTRQDQRQTRNAVGQKEQPSLRLPPKSQDTVSFPKSLDGKSTGKPKTKDASTQTTHTSLEEPKSPRQDERTAKKKRKRIYSPYGNVKPEPDSLDRFGEYIANAAENVLWGPEETTSRTSESGKPKKPRHWRDRLSKRLDSVMGIHTDDQVYDSFERELSFQKKQYENAKDKDDPMFLYNSRYPGKNKKHKAKRKRTHPSQKTGKSREDEVPFWEEEGNIVSVLFGRTASGNRLTFDNFLDRAERVNMMTTLFRSIIQSLLLVSSYACRWASVRGAIPQPVVVVGVTAAALSARRHRLWTIGLTLVGMRTLGEMVHGYVYGDQDWEDDSDSDYDSDDDEHDDGSEHDRN